MPQTNTRLQIKDNTAKRQQSGDIVAINKLKYMDELSEDHVAEEERLSSRRSKRSGASPFCYKVNAEKAAPSGFQSAQITTFDA